MDGHGITSNAPPQPALQLADERTEVLRVAGLRLLCRHWGEASAPAVVLLHGLRGFSGTWRTLAATLSRKYHLIALDQRGRGESDWDPGQNYYTDAYVADLESVVEQLGLTRFALLGHSMGGTTAYVYADRHPERLAALVIEDIAPGSSTRGRGAQRIVSEMSALPASFRSWAEARAYWRAKRPGMSDDALELRITDTLREDRDGAIVWRYDARGISQTRLRPDPSRIVDLWPVVARIAVPTLIIRGEHSDFCPAETVEEMRKCNPRITSLSVPGASHYVHDDAPGLFAEHVLRFLSRCGWKSATEANSL
ncbi:MAG TPA: alpha/beta hydrolase [Steroidobacteraceae bacterium]|nr:alpha/beta hydrolase [Steroidobacteraceae bacterium]